MNEFQVGDFVVGFKKEFQGIITQILVGGYARVYWFVSVDGVARYETSSINSLIWCKQRAIENGWL